MGNPFDEPPPSDEAVGLIAALYSRTWLTVSEGGKVHRLHGVERLTRRKEHPSLCGRRVAGRRLKTGADLAELHICTRCLEAAGVTLPRRFASRSYVLGSELTTPTHHGADVGAPTSPASLPLFDPSTYSKDLNR